MTSKNTLQFSEKNQKSIDEFFAQAKQSGMPRNVAVFDADGTLWHDDVGDCFLKEGFSRGLFRKGASMEEYERVHDESPLLAYELLVKWLEGQTESAVFEFCSKLLREKSPSPFVAQQALIKRFHQEGFEVWVVSASPWWVVVTAAKEYFDIDASRVLAARTKVDTQGVLLPALMYDLPYRESKVTALERFVCVQPQFIAGNSMGDWSLLHQSLSASLVIHDQRPGEPYFDAEVKLLEKVKNHYLLDLKLPAHLALGRLTRNWLIQDWVNL